jgi:ribosomal protein S14
VKYKIFCFLRMCLRCKPTQTDEGIGGKCIDCGRMHGFVTSEELRRYADRELAKRVA